ncbi:MULTISPECIES: pyridoxamine 5'-phosphate oxidase family protein [Pseudonocardia]|uniref:Pyridoxamine 5'-phosphate oxidase n=2 Tax=Pseudonocardia TaxID=1847 RepID=A0A1Y2MWX5_PSEAH|nr:MULTISPECIES: pyridoxamine 5'-phosphate oxidase family protein [Pseudonocardia]OSY39663.1 Pyridoxamine 5'-phosphate oxidase [Pseudonocardia autotrophica]TDN72794.1 pyridoxamine 5'-phosphate oxidase [Pseudonocardia autotrophica]BBG03509.1 pyridoxamine 5'-phosphate oxidase [Pseudonocardia autotrophica]GEC24929.1 pyridoxamine 5'-phosphate oxidase [Pseudonocardia saturnea]
MSTPALSTALLTDEDLAFLARPLYGFLTVAGAAEPPQPRPVWFETGADGAIHLSTMRESPKLRRLGRGSRASLVVTAPVGERERWVAVAARATVHEDGVDELVTRLAGRYWDLDDRADDLTAMLAEDNVRVQLHPEKVWRFAF